VDSATSIFGVLMFLPMLALILAAIVLTAAIQNVVPALMKPLVVTEVAGVSLIWVIVGGLTLLLLLILAFSAIGGGGGGAKTKKTKKTKKEKKPKKVKPAKKKRK
jgi:predicted PurR-regulated permease PerM